MKLSAKKRDILDVLSRVQGLTGRKSSLAITSSVLLKTIDRGIHIVATDLETGFEGLYPATIESEGAIAINARKLFEIVRDFPVDDINIAEIENHWIEISNNNIEYHIVGMDPDDFPDIPKIGDISFFEVKSNCLKEMIEKTVMVTGAPEDQRAHIIGILFEHIVSEDPQSNLVRMVSLDGSWLSKVDCACSSDIKLPTESKILIPKKGLVEVNRFIGSTGSVMVGIKDNHFIAKKATETIMIRLLEGEFPEYQGILKKTDEYDIKLDNHVFTMMLKRMSILSSDDYKSVIFYFEKDKLTISSTNPDIGESKENMVIEYSGKPIEVAFNPKYFIDTLNAINDDTVIMNIMNDEKPCVLHGENDKKFISVIAPMRV